MSPEKPVVIHPILEKVEQFLRDSGISPSKFGDEAVNDPRFVFDLREGREPRRKTVERVQEYLADPSRNAA